MRVKKLTFLSAAVALAMILSFVESLVPPISAIPGVKLGLANLVTVFLLYRVGRLEACIVTLIRIALASLLFGSFVSFVYSLFGAILSIAVMIAAKELLPFSEIGVSVLGGVFHNLGQILAAILFFENTGLAYYMIPLTVSGTVAGVAIGLLGGIVTRRLERILKK